MHDSTKHRLSETMVSETDHQFPESPRRFDSQDGISTVFSEYTQIVV